MGYRDDSSKAESESGRRIREVHLGVGCRKVFITGTVQS